MSRGWAVVLVLLAALPAQAGARRALVVGVSVDVDGANLGDGAAAAADDAARFADALPAWGFAAGDVTLLRKRVLRDEFIDALNALACVTQRGDLAVVYFSGHGGRIDDVDHDEDDGRDETWRFSDGVLVDDDLHGVWKQFPAGAAIVAVADACHSGTSMWIKAFDDDDSAALAPGLASLLALEAPAPRVDLRAVRAPRPPLVAPVLCRDNARFAADLLQMSAVDDAGLAAGPVSGSLFTGTLVSVLDEGRYAGDSWQALRDDVDRRCRREHGRDCPPLAALFLVPAQNGWDRRRPFSLPP